MSITGVDALAQIKELEAEAVRVQEKADETLGRILAKIRDTADIGCGGHELPKPLDSPPPNGKTATNGKQKAVKKAAVKKSTKTTDTKRSNSQPLRGVIWDILAKSDRSWRKSLPELPKGVTGLKATELKTIIEAEGLWTSTSNSEIGGQITQHLLKFRADGKVERGEQKRYYVVDGAEYE